MGFASAISSFKNVGSGYCRSGYYAGWKKEDATIEKCKQKCASESKCVAFSLKAGHTCSRYDSRAGSCSSRPSGRNDHVSWIKTKATKVQPFEKTSFPVSMGSTTSVGIKNSDFTAMAWVKRTGNGSGDYSIFGTDTTSTNKGLHLIVRNRKYYMGFYANDCGSPTGSALNKWEHVAFVYEGRAQKIYVNGKLTKTCSNKNAFSGDGNVNIGQWASGRKWVGAIKNAKIYQGAPSETDIAKAAAGGTWEYVGCYKDDGHRDLDHYKGNGKKQEDCTVLCKDFTYFSMQAGSQCFCGNKYATASKYQKRPDSECGSTGLGGSWRNAVYKQAGSTAVVITGLPGCAQYTKKMATGLTNTHKEVSECDKDVKFVRDKFGEVHEVTSDINDIAKDLAYVSKKVKEVYDKIVLLPPKGFGIADMLGKIPKIGIYIKSGMKFAERIINTVNRILQRVYKVTKKVDWVVKKGKQAFTKIAEVTDPATKFLKHSSDVMNAAVGCMGGNCNSGTVGQKLETANREAWNKGGGTALSTTEKMGKTCTDVLNPTKLIMATIADIGKKIKHAIAPVKKVVNKIGDFFRDMMAAIDRFRKMLSENDHAQCALAILGHVAKPFNLAMCPLAEIQNGMQYIMEVIIHNLEVVITDIMNDAIEAFVELIIPDDFAVTIPDFRKVLPVDAWFVGCTAASLAWPQYAADIQKWNKLPLPYSLTGKQMEQEILEDAKMSMPSMPKWKSACEEAYKELSKRTDFSRCDKAWGTTIFQDMDNMFDMFKNMKCWDLKKMNCKQGCPGGWEHFLTTDHGCCKSFWSCGGNRKNCRRYKCHGSDVCRVTLFQHDHFRGAMKTYGPGTYGGIWRNDDVSSIKVDGDGCKAVAYEHGNFNGWKVTIPKGHYTLSQLSRMGFRNDAMSSLRIGGSGTHTGYCKPNTPASRIGGYNSYKGYKDLIDCYLRRCMEDSSCVAATFGHGDCIAYKQCEGLERNGGYMTMYKQVGRRRFEDLEMLKPTTDAEAETLKIMKRRMEEHGLFVPSNEEEAELLGAFHRRLEEYEMMDSADATDDEMFPPTNTTKLEMMAPATDADVTAEA